MKTSRNSKHISIKRLRDMLAVYMKKISHKEFLAIMGFITHVENNRNK